MYIILSHWKISKINKINVGS